MDSVPSGQRRGAGIVGGTLGERVLDDAEACARLGEGGELLSVDDHRGRGGPAGCRGRERAETGLCTTATQQGHRD